MFSGNPDFKRYLAWWNPAFQARIAAFAQYYVCLNAAAVVIPFEMFRKTRNRRKCWFCRFCNPASSSGVRDKNLHRLARRCTVQMVCTVFLCAFVVGANSSTHFEQTSWIRAVVAGGCAGRFFPCCALHWLPRRRTGVGIGDVFGVFISLRVSSVLQDWRHESNKFDRTMGAARSRIRDKPASSERAGHASRQRRRSSGSVQCWKRPI